jgi:hypothetical protein
MMLLGSTSDRISEPYKHQQVPTFIREASLRHKITSRWEARHSLNNNSVSGNHILKVLQCRHHSRCRGDSGGQFVIVEPYLSA